MYSLGYTFREAIDLYFKTISNYHSFYTILLAIVILGFVLIANMNGKNNIVVTTILNVISMFLIFYYFGFEIIDNLDSCFNHDFLNNICLYFVNSIIALIAASITITSLRIDYTSRFVLMVMYCLLLGNLLYSLYITYTINANLLVTLGNIAPMIHVGNLLSFMIYIYIIIVNIVAKLSKYYDNKKHLLYK